MSSYRYLATMAMAAGMVHCNVVPPSPSTTTDADLPVYTGPEMPDASMLSDSSDADPVELGAELIINELNANIDGSCDLVELVVTQAGQLQGIVLKERRSIVFEGGENAMSEGVYILVHFNAGALLCNPNASASETSTPNQYPSALYAGNLDSAFDVYIEDPGLVATDNVLSLHRVDGSIMDAVLVSDDPTGTAAADSESQAAVMAEAGQWMTTTHQIPIGGFIDEVFNMHAVQDLDATSNERWGQSLQRKRGAMDANHRGDWFSADNMPAATWGQPNPD